MELWAYDVVVALRREWHLIVHARRVVSIRGWTGELAITYIAP